MRSLRMKMVMIMVILILALMLTTGAFLMSGVGNFYVSQFYEQVAAVVHGFAGLQHHDRQPDQTFADLQHFRS